MERERDKMGIKAIYAASLDPITNGHLNVIERASKMYDVLYVVVANNPKKKYMFDIDERMELAIESTLDIQNVKVIKCENQYVVDVARENDATVIVKGIRNFNDLQYEAVLAEECRRMDPEIETVFIPCYPEYAHISSSMVKGHLDIDGWEKHVAKSVHPYVLGALKYKNVNCDYEFVKNKFYKTLGKFISTYVNMDDFEVKFEELYNCYKNRPYHNIKHILYMLDAYDRIVEDKTIEPSDHLELAIWYHDVIYDTHDNYDANEQMSAKFFEDKMGIFLTKKDSELISEIIKSTDYKYEMSCLDINGQLKRFIRDLDLMILGADSYRYKRYSEGVRKEFSHIPEKDYCEKRIVVLKKFVKDPIYFSLKFTISYEYQALCNMKKEIGELQKRLEEIGC